MWTEIKAGGKYQNNEWRIKQNTLTNGQDVARLKNEMSENKNVVKPKKDIKRDRQWKYWKPKIKCEYFIKIRKTKTVRKLIHQCF